MSELKGLLGTPSLVFGFDIKFKKYLLNFFKIKKNETKKDNRIIQRIVKITFK